MLLSLRKNERKEIVYENGLEVFQSSQNCASAAQGAESAQPTGEATP
jgi:hypothetical protein